MIVKILHMFTLIMLLGSCTPKVKLSESGSKEIEKKKPIPSGDQLLPEEKIIPEDKFKIVMNVGPGMEYEEPIDVPWESINPGTLIKIHWRSSPYLNKWVIARPGTITDPIVVRGVLSSDGIRPVISGINAKTRTELSYWNEARSIIKIGGASTPATSDTVYPSFITIENLEVRGAHPSYSFTDDREPAVEDTYDSNASPILIELGENITIRNCEIHDGGNGLFVASGSKDIVIEGNYIHGNGIVDSQYEHNSYTGAQGIIFQFNHYGRLRVGARGNNLKDRSRGTIIRYNWIDTGSRTLDLVDSNHEIIYSHPDYDETFVYGNVLIKRDVHGNSQIVHYGGDTYSHYRKGTLWFFNNTVISYRADNTTIMRLSTNEESVQFFNNIIYNTASGNRLAIMSSAGGDFHLYSNWIKSGWRICHEETIGSLDFDSDNIEGIVPGLESINGENFFLTSSSSANNRATSLPESIRSFVPIYQYKKHLGAHEQLLTDILHLGAFQLR